MSPADRAAARRRCEEAEEGADRVLWRRDRQIDVCKACGFVREGTIAATLRHHERCAAARMYGEMMRHFADVRASLPAALDAIDQRDEEVAGLRAEVERWRLAAEDRREEARAADAQAERLRGERRALLVHLKNLGANVASQEEERDAQRARLAEVERELAEGRALAGEAIDKLEEASAYVDRYFREKWGFTDEDIAALRARLAGKKG